MTFAPYSAAGAVVSSSSTKEAFAREAAFALKLYPLVAIAGMAIGFASALLGYPLATLQAPPSVEAPMPAQPVVLPTTPIDTTPVIPSPDDSSATVIAAAPTQKDRVELRALLWMQAKGVIEPKLAGEPKIGDTVPKWVQLKPLPSDIEPRLKWVGFVDKNAKPTGIFVYTDDVFIVNPTNQVVGIVPLTDVGRATPARQ
jgi:hypothetical protein